MRVAPLILHIRRRLAGNRPASFAPGCRFNAGCTRKLDAMARPVHQYDRNLRTVSGIRGASYTRAMDAYRGDIDCLGRNLADNDDPRRAVASPLAGNRRRCCRNVRPRVMVGRCSPFWMEARRSSASQEQYSLSINPPKFPDSKEASVRLPRVCDLSRSGADRKRSHVDNDSYQSKAFRNL